MVQIRSYKGRTLATSTTVKHFKGNTYIVIAFALHTESNERLVIYVDSKDHNKVFARPAEMFFSKVDHEKYPEATQEYRFEW